MSKQSYSREIRYTENLEVTVGEKAVLVEGPGTSVRFLKKTDWERAMASSQNDPFKALGLCKRVYAFMPKEWWEEIHTKGFAVSNDFYNHKPLAPPKDWVSLERELVFVEHSSHMLFNLDDEIFSRAHFQSYISGIGNDRYDLDKVMKILEMLKNKGIVLSYKKMDIPHYNCDRNRNQAVEFTWILPQEKYNFYWKKILSKKSQYPSTEIPKIIFEKEFGLQGGKK